MSGPDEKTDAPTDAVNDDQHLRAKLVLVPLLKLLAEQLEEDGPDILRWQGGLVIYYELPLPDAEHKHRSVALEVSGGRAYLQVAG